MLRYLSAVPRLPVQDISRTCDFYRQALGFDVCEKFPHGAPTFAILERDGVSLQFFIRDEHCPAEVGHAVLSLNVASAAAVIDQLQHRIPIEWGPEVYWYGRREFAIRDPDGYLLIISEETSDPPTCEEP